MSENKLKRIGIIGFGQIGASLFDMIRCDQDHGLEVAFIYEVSKEIAAGIPEELRLESIAGICQHQVDLVVEAAHPEVVRMHGKTILNQRNLMIMSVSSLADPALENTLKEACRKSGTRLYIPHGATLGLDGLRDGLSIWEEVSITMRKNPANLDFTAVPALKPEPGSDVTVLYEGPTRGILPLFPKNVNSHATLGLVTLGLDKTRSILIADPQLEESIIEINAWGGGNSIHIERRNPIKGVTGKLTLLSVLESIKTALGLERGLRVC